MDIASFISQECHDFHSLDENTKQLFKNLQIVKSELKNILNGESSEIPKSLLNNFSEKEVEWLNSFELDLSIVLSNTSILYYRNSGVTLSISEFLENSNIKNTGSFLKIFLHIYRYPIEKFVFYNGKIGDPLPYINSAKLPFAHPSIISFLLEEYKNKYVFNKKYFSVKNDISWLVKNGINCKQLPYLKMIIEFIQMNILTGNGVSEMVFHLPDGYTYYVSDLYYSIIRTNVKDISLEEYSLILIEMLKIINPVYLPILEKYWGGIEELNRRNMQSVSKFIIEDWIRICYPQLQHLLFEQKLAKWDKCSKK